MLIKNAVVTAGKMIVGQKNFARVANEFFLQLVFLTTIKNYLVSKVAAEQTFFFIPQNVKRKTERKKHILVLDMDETLVYTRRSTKPAHSNYILTKCDHQDMYIEPRPFVNQFLTAAGSIFKVYIYTAGNRKYADAVLDQIDVAGVIEKRFYRDSCKKVNGNIIKDLRYLKKVLKEKNDMILVDDNPDSIKNNYPFSLKIEVFEGNQEDTSLKEIFKELLKFYN